MIAVLDGVSGIYGIRRIGSDKIYIGSTGCFERRLRDHRGMLRSGKHPNQHLQSSFSKHGESCFVMFVLELCPVGELLAAEQRWLDSFPWRQTYNCRRDVTGGRPVIADPIFSMDGGGNVTRHSSPEAASESSGASRYGILRAARYGSTSRGFRWSWSRAFPNPPRRTRRTNPVYCYTKAGGLVGRFRSVREAAAITGTTPVSISACMAGRNILAGGRRWSRSPDATFRKSRKTKPVLQLSGGEVVAEFESARRAASELGISYRGISDAANGRIKTSGGFAWEFAKT